MKGFKVVLAAALALLMAAGALAETALPPPETKEGTIYLEGMPETVTLTRFDSQRGYTLWYDANMFAYVPADEGSDIDEFRPANPDAIPGVSLAVTFSAQLDYTFEDAKRDVRASLWENGYTVTDIDTASLFPQLDTAGYHGVKGDGITESYVINSGAGAFYITLQYPLVAAEGFSARMRYMTMSFELLKAD